MEPARPRAAPNRTARGRADSIIDTSLHNSFQLQPRWIGFSEDDAEPNRRRRKYAAAKLRFCFKALSVKLRGSHAPLRRTMPSTLLTFLCRPAAANQEAHQKINNDRRGNGKEKRTNKRGPKGWPNNK